MKKNHVTNVEFVGFKQGEKLWKLYRNARCVIVPAEWYENMPNMLLEGMLFSKPLIVSNLGSLKELIMHNQNGLLFEPKNINELREKIDLVFKNDKLARKLGKNAYHDAITKYSPKEHYQKLITVFNNAITEERSKWKRQS